VGGIDLEPRVWSTRDWTVAIHHSGVVAVILGLIGAQLTSLTVSREWERGTMEQLVSTR